MRRARRCQLGSFLPRWQGARAGWLAVSSWRRIQVPDLNEFFPVALRGTALDNNLGMKTDNARHADARLLRHLVLAVAVKLAVLVLLWWGFVRDTRVPVDVDTAARHIGAAAPTGEQP